MCPVTLRTRTYIAHVSAVASACCPTACREQVKLIAELLLSKETINHDDIVATIGARPFTHKAYDDYLHANEKDAEQEESEKRAAEEGAAKNIPNLAPA